MLRSCLVAATTLLFSAGPLAAQQRTAPRPLPPPAEAPALSPAFNTEAPRDGLRPPAVDQVALLTRVAEIEAGRQADLLSELGVDPEAIQRASEAAAVEARRWAAAAVIPTWYAEARSGGRAPLRVNTTDDDRDGTCDQGATGDCSPLDALDLANADLTPDVIRFDQDLFAGGVTLVPDAPATIVTPITIDGTATGLAAGLVGIDGVGEFDAALLVMGTDASDSVVRGLALVSSFLGLQIDGADRVVVEGNFIGTNAAGDDLGNSFAGIDLSFATDTVIGGADSAAANTVGFNQFGIQASGFSFFNQSVGTEIVGNFIGTNAAGDDLGNRLFGIVVGGGIDTVIGGTEPGSANTVGFNATGISVSGSVGTEIVGNFVGTNVASDNLGNDDFGLDVRSATGIVIGGAEPGSANTVGFNGSGIGVRGTASKLNEGTMVVGNFVGTNAAGDDLGNVLSGIFVAGATDTVVGGIEPGAANTVAFSGEAGIIVTGSPEVPTVGTQVAGNFIGTNAAGEDLGNDFYGIYVEGATDTEVGGTEPGAANAVGFNGTGIRVQGSPARPTVGAGVVGNLVGTNAAGSDLGNFFGIFVSGMAGMVVGGTEPGAANTVGFNSVGLQVAGSPDTPSEATEIVGNFVGTTAAGGDVGNGTGVVVVGARGTIVGGTVAGAANTVGFNGIGVLLRGSLMDRTLETEVVGNFVGTNAAGDDLGNDLSGIAVSGAKFTVIGGEVPGAANVVGFNGTGISVRGAPDAPAGVTQVIGNLIGTNAAGEYLGNGAAGIHVEGASDTVIGGRRPDAANTIAYNGTGILVLGATTDVAILRNAIADNGALGVDIGAETGPDGVTANDEGDRDDGPNGFQNFPVITAVGPGAPVAFTLDSTPSTTFRVEAFASDEADPSGYGEGARFLGTVEVRTDAAGMAAGEVATTDLSGGEWVTTTATSINDSIFGYGGTSEFSELAHLPGVATTDGPVAEFALAAYPNPVLERVTVVVTVPAPGPVRVALYDVLGREVARIHDGPASGEVRAVLDAGRFSPGAYVVRASGGAFVDVRSLTIVR